MPNSCPATGVQSCLCAGNSVPLQCSCCSYSLLAVSVARPQQALLQLSPTVRYPPPVPFGKAPRHSIIPQMRCPPSTALRNTVNSQKCSQNQISEFLKSCDICRLTSGGPDTVSCHGTMAPHPRPCEHVLAFLPKYTRRAEGRALLTGIRDGSC